MALYVLAADLGGTNLRMAVVASDGQILHRERCPTPRDGDAELIVSAIVAQIHLREEVAELDRLGVLEIDRY